MSTNHWFVVYMFVCTILASVRADIAADLDRARELRKNNDYLTAESLLNQVLIQSTSADHMLDAKSQLTALMVSTGRTERASIMLTQIQADFTSNQNLPQALTTVAHAYRNTDALRCALQLYRTVADKHPKSPPAIWCRMYDAIINIRLRSYPQALETRVKLQADFAADEGYPIVLCLILQRHLGYQNATTYSG